MQAKGYIKKEGSLRCQIKKEEEEGWWIEIFKRKDEDQKPEVEYLAGSGQHVFTWNNKYIWASHHEGETLNTGHERRPTKQETMTLYAYGTDTTILRELIDAAIVHSMKKDDGKIGIYE